jgi:hypothetical protein
MRGVICLLLAACPLGAQAAGPDEGQFSFTTGFDYSVGSYGQSRDTTITYIPVTGKYEIDRWTFGLTIPYIEIEGLGNVTRDIGRFKSTTSTATRTESGIGDIVGSATYNLFSSRDGRALDLTGKLKLGTADENKGLGTGENDLYVQVDAYQTVDHLTPFATLGYKFLGSPPGANLHNVFYASFGGSYKLTPEQSVGLMWFGQQKASDAGAVQSEITAFFNQRLSREWKAQLYGLLGLADGSPDFGVGAMVTRSF